MKRLIIKVLIKIRKIKKYLKNRNSDAKIKSKEDLILELLTKDLTSKERYCLKNTVDRRFKNKSLELNRESQREITLYNQYFGSKISQKN